MSNNLRFECEVITPMFLRGADGNTPELRPPSIKAMMRFWWRAVKGASDITALKLQEGKIFGGTGKEHGKSTFTILLKEKSCRVGSARPLPHHTGVNDKKTFLRNCFSPGGQFEVIITTKNYKTAKGEERKAPDWLGDLFLITSLLGGFGYRSRRGFGSVMIKGIKPSLELISNALNQIYEKEIFTLRENKTLITSSFPSQVFYPSIKEIRLGTESSSIDSLLKKIGEASHKYNPYGSEALGMAEPSRLASPVYVSILKMEEKYRPIVTTLHVSKEDHEQEKTQDLFKEAIC